MANSGDKLFIEGNSENLFLNDMFCAIAEQMPKAIAVSFGADKITYRQLNIQSDNLAKAISLQSPDSTIIGISTTRSIDMVIGVLAILKSGKAYLPLDASYPQNRLQQIVSDSRIDCCLSPDAEVEFYKSFGTNIISYETYKVVENARPLKQSGLGYVLYTSGSTGKPKGVCMAQAALVNLMLWQHKHSIAGKGTKTLQFAPLSFDVSFQEIFATLTSGGTLVLIEDDMRLDPQSLLHFIDEQCINRIFVPFVALQYLAEAADAAKFFPSCLKEVMTAGEQLKITAQVVSFFSALPDCILYNQYGPTECHVVTELKLEGKPTEWPALPTIGTAIDNTEILVLDEQLNLITNGKIGELCISGNCLAEGYLNRLELTNEKFIMWNHPSKGMTRIYRTGDLARFQAGGNIEFLGRIDDQVKIRGYRIELGEIEVFLNLQQGIQQAIVVAREDVPGQKRLIAYLVSSNDKKDTTALRNAINQHLPDYMMPSAFVWLDVLPKTTSGKVDKKALPKPEIKRPEISVLYKAPSTDIEKIIASTWASLLQFDEIGVNDNFFELGGNSLLALKTVADLKLYHALTVPVTKIYQFPTVAGIASFLDVNKKPSAKTNKKIASQNANKDIAVIAMSGRFPGANNISELWEILKQGKETVSFFSEEELSPFIASNIKADPDYVRARGIIEGASEFDASFFNINPKLAQLMDPQQRIFLQIAWEALESAGYVLEKYDGSIAVFAGSGNNTYYINNVMPNTDLISNVGSFNVMTVNEKDYVATRTAYELNLKGPAVSVYSACSTSLLAIAQAVESIRKGQCDMALAGGVSITTPIKSGHIYQEGAMFSKDGHCRSFDENARGTVFSDGAGIVLLKNLEDAQKDGDKIFAVIKGAGINNDGGSKGSFTAPSAEGQAAAIGMAIQDAGVSPSTITYVEAHGTATPLGDPIEIEGLNIAFGKQDRKQYCAIGSIKSNFGHLTAAAGVAGFIKTVLSLHYKKLLPSINFKKPNPNIDFANSPFFVNVKLKDWDANEKRRAGVSSFGVGGTNVHVVLEEFEYEQKETSASRPAQLINWSAKTNNSREAYAKKLEAFAQLSDNINLADIAFTLQTSRQHFSSRRFVVASDKNELIEKLNSSFVSPAESNQLKENLDEVVFSFPGQGSQYVNMGIDLYKHESVFKNAVDECAEILKQTLHEDIRNVIYPIAANTEAEEKLNNTYYTQPAIFIVEYATAKLWMSWGIQPSAFIGHSIGEFVAAHLAGVFSLEDGLRLIATRGRMMSEMPRGSMLAVNAEFEKIKSLLSDDLSLAVVNSPGSCVIAGPTPSTEILSKKLSELNISNKVLATSHAFHSMMMDPIVAPFEEIVRSVKLSLPKIPIVSTVTGKWMTDKNATDPSYWAAHLRSAVLFADAVATLLEDEKRLVLETGPKNVIASLIRQQGKKSTVAIASFESGDGQSEYYSILKAVGQLWLNGIEIDWRKFYESEQREKLNLPTYAFEKNVFWVDPISNIQQQNVPVINNGSNGIPTNISQNISPQNNIMRKNKLIKQIKELLENASGIDMSEVTADMNFIEMGFDSLLLTQIALNLKKEFKLPITFRQLNEEYGTLDSLASFLDENLPQEQTQVVQKSAAQIAQPEMQQTNFTNINPVNNNIAIGLISQQIQLLAQQVALLQGNGNNAPQQIAYSSSAVSPVEKRPVEIEVSAEELAELKKPFGATAKIEKQSSQLSAKQETFIKDFIKKYNEKTKNSKNYTQEHRAYMADPRVVTGFRPVTKEIVYSLVVNKSKGSHVWDIDGNEYIDALNGFGSNFFGYQPEIITKAIQQQIENGYEIGPQHELAGPVCKLICEFTGLDRAALCNTGSEAVLGAMRIARTVTGRSIIVAFSGSYHGIVDEVIVRGTKKLKSFAAAPGIMPEAVQNMLILDYGTDESLKIIKERAHELAAVLVEPVQSRRPEFQPIEFLKKLRDITQESGTALIFDEVITGFRMHPRGAQGMFGIQADIATYGKVIGAGISIGVIAGKKYFMDALDGGFWQYGDSSTPETGVTYFAGTFVRHPLALAASKASLDYMKSKGPALQEGINEKTKKLADGMNAICSKSHLPFFVAQFGSLWKIKFKEDVPFSELLFALMRYKGVHILDGFPCFLTEAHTNDEVEIIVYTFSESVNEMIEAGLFRSKKLNGTRAMHLQASPEQPPVPGARLGKDMSGNPAWFITDPERPGKYLKVK